MGVCIIDSTATKAGFVAGASARGEFHCIECGYGITVQRVLPTCPMCRGDEWKPWTRQRPIEALDLADLHA